MEYFQFFYLNFREATASTSRSLMNLDGNLSFPIAQLAEVEFSVVETARTILTSSATAETVCQKQPIGVQRNVSFLLNSSIFKDRRDIRADDLGTWNHNGVITTYLEVKRNPVGESMQ